MKKNKSVVIFSSLLLCLVMAAIGTEFVVSLSGKMSQMRASGLVILALSLLPLIVGTILLKAMKAFSAEAQQFATRDPLTGLYNRRAFWDFLNYEIERAKRQEYRFSLMIVDIDNFKTINDIYGHQTGDEYLRQFSTLFKASVRKGDIPARYGGDEFAAILPVCDEGQSYIAAKRFLDNLRDHSFLLPGGATVHMTASIGLAVYPDHEKESESLFLVADGMLRQAKLSGKDRVGMPSDEVDIMSLKSAGQKSIFIMDAIRKKQVVPYFQPIVSSRERTVLAYEVLTRIVTPEKVFPAEDFIEAAEGMGAIGRIDYQLIDQAFAITRKNDYRGLLFLNLSPKALVINEFMPTVRQLMKNYGIEPSQMVFEITERNSVKGLDVVQRTVSDLKQDGFKFAIDDFGSGYASFMYIKLFHVDFLKIDGEFIRNMSNNGGMDEAIVKNIAGLAAFLGIKTVAEHVESEDIFRQVRSAGIDYAQGYHIRRPVPDLVI